MVAEAEAAAAEGAEVADPLVWILYTSIDAYHYKRKYPASNLCYVCTNSCPDGGQSVCHVGQVAVVEARVLAAVSVIGSCSTTNNANSTLWWI